MNKQTGIIILLVGLLAGVFLSRVSVSREEGLKLAGSRDYLPFLNTATSSQMAVTTSSSQVLASSTCSQYVAFTNDGSNVVYIALDGDKPAKVNQGIRLNASGGSFEMFANDGSLYTGGVRMIASGGTSVVGVTCK